MNKLDYQAIDLSMLGDLRAYLAGQKDGVSEFTFGGLYLFRARYGYQIACDGENDEIGKTYIVSGSLEGRKFFSTPCHLPHKDVLDELFATHDYWKNIPQSVLEANRDKIAEMGISVEEDRDNFDYLYSQNELASLSGKKFHKKKNHVNSFLLSYPNHEEKTIGADTVGDAIKVLDAWRAGRPDEGDYKAAKEALELRDTLGMDGMVVYIEGRPAAYCLGEQHPNGRIYLEHFEKGLDEYRGIYQYVNMAFAASLAGRAELINREQDLGEEGLRQAKMTYRPVDFVKKFKGFKN
jgi:hypothetical protein